MDTPGVEQWINQTTGAQVDRTGDRTAAELSTTSAAPVDVWWCRWRQTSTDLRRLLSDEEGQRLARLHRADDKVRFTVGAVLVRVLAGRRLGLNPAAVVVDRACRQCGEPHGKVTVPALPDCHLSVSHSGELVGVAVCPHAEVGLDVEASTTPPAVLDDLRPVLTPGEVSWLDGMSPMVRGHAALRLWTRKEAVLKATGDGLSADMADLELAVPSMTTLSSWTRRSHLAGVVAMADVVADDKHIASAAALTSRPITVVVHDASALGQMALGG